MNIAKIEKVLRITGYIFAAVNLTILALTNIILIGKLNVSIWFIPINPRDNVLLILLLLPAVMPLVASIILKRNTCHEKIT